MEKLIVLNQPTEVSPSVENLKKLFKMKAYKKGTPEVAL